MFQVLRQYLPARKAILVFSETLILFALNAVGFTMWMAGGGVRGGLRYGATNETGRTAVENKIHLHDIHATLLHLLGLDHERLTFRYGGRDFRLTDVHGRVVKDILV